MRIIRNRTLCLVLITVSILYLIISHDFMGVSVINIAKFILLNTLSIYLPGITILSLTGIRTTRVGVVCLSYMFGYAYIVIEYYFSELFDRKLSFLFVSIVSAVVAVIAMIMIKKKHGKLVDVYKSDTDIMELVVLVIYIFANIFGYAANYLGTDVADVFSSHRDIQYWVSNSVALKLSWPADNLFMLGSRLNYHYFSSIPIAFLSEVYGIDVFTMSFSLYCLTKALVVVGGATFLLRSVTHDIVTNALGFILLLFTTGVEGMSVVPIVNHILFAPFGFDIGYAYSMAFMGFLILQWNEERWNRGFFLGMILTWAMCIGAKAPIAAVLLGFAGLVCLYWLIEKNWACSFGYGLPIVGLFIVICKFCVGMFEVADGNAAWKVGIYNSNHFTFMLEADSWDYFGKLLYLIGKKARVFGLIIRTFLLNPAIVFGVSVAVVIVIYLSCKKCIPRKTVYLMSALTITSLFGISLWHLVNEGHSSEMYFSMAALIPMTMLILYSFDSYKNYQDTIQIRHLTVIKKSVSCLFVFLVFVGIVRFMWFGWDGSGLLSNSINGIKNIFNPPGIAEYEELPEKSIRRSDVEALSWIRCNADPKAVVISDKAIVTDNTDYYMYGMFSERQQYIEGTEMLLSLLDDGKFNDEVENRIDFVKSIYANTPGAVSKAGRIGIDYIVQTIDITPDFKPQEGLKLVESTETTNVYQIER